MSQEPMFPILNDPVIRAIPWPALAPHEKQAQRNHSQSLRTLASRGGLSICEAYYILKDQSYPTLAPKQTAAVKYAYRIALMRILHAFEKAKEPATLPAAPEIKERIE